MTLAKGLTGGHMPLGAVVVSARVPCAAGVAAVQSYQDDGLIDRSRRPPALVRIMGEAMQAGVSFAARGNLILPAPPLVIEELDLERVLGLLDRLLGKL